MGPELLALFEEAGYLDLLSGLDTFTKICRHYTTQILFCFYMATEFCEGTKSRVDLCF